VQWALQLLTNRLGVTNLNLMQHLEYLHNLYSVKLSNHAAKAWNDQVLPNRRMGTPFWSHKTDITNQTVGWQTSTDLLNFLRECFLYVCFLRREIFRKLEKSWLEKSRNLKVNQWFLGNVILKLLDFTYKFLEK
jgi:hypothetical protein